MNFYKKFLTFSRGKQITSAVCAAHLFAVIALFGHHLLSGRLKPPKPMIVRTVAAYQKPKTEPIRKELPKKAATVAASPPPAKSIKKSAPTKPKPAQPVAKALPNHLLTEIAQSLETLSTEAKASSQVSLQIPSPIQAKAELSSSLKTDPSYAEALIAYLQTALDLPEYGEVKVKIEINRFGLLAGLEILETKSKKNGEFLKNRLPELTFPCLNGETQSFTITFRNVEMD